MVLRSQQTFDKVYLDREHPSDFIEFIMHSIERELVNKLMDELKNHEIRIIELKEPDLWEDFPMTGEAAVEQDLVCEKLVQCKNCRMNFPWCQRFRDELGGNGFCPYGKEIEDEQKRICLSCEDCRHDGVKHAYDYACDKCTDMDKWEGQ